MILLAFSLEVGRGKLAVGGDWRTPKDMRQHDWAGAVVAIVHSTIPEKFQATEYVYTAYSFTSNSEKYAAGWTA
jgi:hypothetical protein